MVRRADSCRGVASAQWTTLDFCRGRVRHTCMWAAHEHADSRKRPTLARLPDEPWRGFTGQAWRDSIDTRRFIQDNYTPYDGDAGFLAGPTERTKGVWARLTAMFPAERERGVYDVDAHTPSSITAHGPGSSTGTPSSSSACRPTRR